MTSYKKGEPRRGEIITIMAVVGLIVVTAGIIAGSILVKKKGPIQTKPKAATCEANQTECVFPEVCSTRCQACSADGSVWNCTDSIWCQWCLTTPTPTPTATPAKTICALGGCWDATSQSCVKGTVSSTTCGTDGNICKNCDDNNPCTTDSCSNGTCAHPLIEGCGKITSTPKLAECIPPGGGGVSNCSECCSPGDCDCSWFGCVCKILLPGTPTATPAKTICALGGCWDATSQSCVKGTVSSTTCGTDGNICKNCDDNNPCTTDSCSNGHCTNLSIPNCGRLASTPTPTPTSMPASEEPTPTPTVVNRCPAGGCWNGTSCLPGNGIIACGINGNICINCNDNNPCTTDSCSNGHCTNLSIPNCGRLASTPTPTPTSMPTSEEPTATLTPIPVLRPGSCNAPCRYPGDCNSRFCYFYWDPSANKGAGDWNRSCRSQNCPDDPNCPTDCQAPPVTEPPENPPGEIPPELPSSTCQAPNICQLFINCLGQPSLDCGLGFACCPPVKPPEATPTEIPISLKVTISKGPTQTATECTTRSQGDANCDGKIDNIDFEIWRKEFSGELSTKTADFNNDTKISLTDFEIWRKGFFTGNPTPVPTITSGPTSHPQPTLERPSPKISSQPPPPFTPAPSLVPICTKRLSGSPSEKETTECKLAGGTIRCGNGWCSCVCGAPTPVSSTTAPPQCIWCGWSCVVAKPGQTCPQIAPPANWDCQLVGTDCRRVWKGVKQP